MTQQGKNNRRLGQVRLLTSSETLVNKGDKGMAKSTQIAAIRAGAIAVQKTDADDALVVYEPSLSSVPSTRQSMLPSLPKMPKPPAMPRMPRPPATPKMRQVSQPRLGYEIVVGDFQYEEDLLIENGRRTGSQQSFIKGPEPRGDFRIEQNNARLLEGPNTTK